MKRKTKNRVLLEVIKRQESEIRGLNGVIASLQAHEKKRDEAWEKYNDDRIKEINAAIRASNNRKTK